MAYDSDIKLDAINTNVDDTITSRLGAIAGIDRGTISVDTSVANSATATVGAVNTSRAVLHHLGGTVNDASDNRVLMSRLALTNSTTITATITGGVSAVHTVSYQLVEYDA